MSKPFTTYKYIFPAVHPSWIEVKHVASPSTFHVRSHWKFRLKLKWLQQQLPHSTAISLCGTRTRNERQLAGFQLQKSQSCRAPVSRRPALMVGNHAKYKSSAAELKSICLNNGWKVHANIRRHAQSKSKTLRLCSVNSHYVYAACVR